MLILRFFFFFFFFQAEDGIRDLTVTGVQTCALPILIVSAGFIVAFTQRVQELRYLLVICPLLSLLTALVLRAVWERRSEERRVGKGVDLGGRRIIKKKKKRG